MDSSIDRHTQSPSSHSSGTPSVDKINMSPPAPKHVTFEPQESTNQTSENTATGKSTKSAGHTSYGSKSEYTTNQQDSAPKGLNNSIKKELNKEILKPGRYKKGLNAQFLRHNPRYVNEPICHVLPNETSRSVEDCLQWGSGEVKGQTKSQPKISHSLDSTSRSAYQSLPSNQRPPPLNKHIPTPKIHGIAPLINEPPKETSRAKIREHISYRHQYNCRTEPNEPVRGKLHGSFVWENKLT